MLGEYRSKDKESRMMVRNTECIVLTRKKGETNERRGGLGSRKCQERGNVNDNLLLLYIYQFFFSFRLLSFSSHKKFTRYRERRKNPWKGISFSNVTFTLHWNRRKVQYNMRNQEGARTTVSELKCLPQSSNFWFKPSQLS